MKVATLGTALCLAAALLSCTVEDEPPPIEMLERPVSFDREAWEANLLEKREAMNRRFAESPTSLLAGVQQLTLERSDNLPAYLGGAGLVEGEPPGQGEALVFAPSGDGWTWRRIDPALTAELRGGPVDPGPLVPYTVFRAGRYTVQVWEADETLNAGVFDAQREDLLAFDGLIFYPPDERFALPARLERFETAEKVQLALVHAGARDFYRYGLLHFALEGEAHRLTAYKISPESETLFVPFRDETAGHETYGAGRALDLPQPEGETLLLDFNEAINFPCCYSPAFNCPVPPAENWLEATIEAGEKNYPIRAMATATEAATTR